MAFDKPRKPRSGILFSKNKYSLKSIHPKSTSKVRKSKWKTQQSRGKVHCSKEIRAECRRHEARCWEHPKIYPPGLYPGPTIGPSDHNGDCDGGNSDGDGGGDDDGDDGDDDGDDGGDDCNGGGDDDGDDGSDDGNGGGDDDGDDISS